VSGQETSRTLLGRVRARDAAAWDRLVELYAPLVMHWLARTGLDEEERRDVFQEVFQAAARHIDAFRKEKPTDTFRGWLRTITRNKVNDWFRRQAREPRGVGGSEIRQRIEAVSAPDAPETPEPEKPEESDDGEAHLVRAALERLRGEFRPKTWRVFERCVLDGSRPVDVAEELEMTPGAVRVAKSRVLQRLRAELGDILPEETFDR